MEDPKRRASRGEELRTVIRDEIRPESAHGAVCSGAPWVKRFAAIPVAREDSSPPLGPDFLPRPHPDARTRLFAL